MDTMTASKLAFEEPIAPVLEQQEDDEPMLPDYVIKAALRYMDMVKDKPECWMSVDEAFDQIEREMGWK